jgi:hypothetical protein
MIELQQMAGGQADGSGRIQARRSDYRQHAAKEGRRQRVEQLQRSSAAQPSATTTAKRSQSKATPAAKLAHPPKPEGLDVWQLRHDQLGGPKDDGPQVVVVKAGGGGAFLTADGSSNGLQGARAAAAVAAAAVPTMAGVEGRQVNAQTSQVGGQGNPLLQLDLQAGLTKSQGGSGRQR